MTLMHNFLVSREKRYMGLRKQNGFSDNHTVTRVVTPPCQNVLWLLMQL